MSVVHLLRNASTGVLLARRVRLATSMWRRLVGWLSRSAIDAEEGLLFEDCSAIHTIGMRTPIDVIFLDEYGRVKQIHPAVGPGRGRVGCSSASKVLEMGPGFVDAHDLLIGDRLLLEPATVAS
jgi:uncharacterized membrane protein (UPF0127 family)